MSSDADKAGAPAAGSPEARPRIEQAARAVSLVLDFARKWADGTRRDREAFEEAEWIVKLLTPPLDQPPRAAPLAPLEARIKELEEALAHVRHRCICGGSEIARRALSTTKGADNDAG